jgi:CheY-like chemotaxis protein
VLKNLFDLFYQADRTLDRSDGGLGIGLSLVKSLVQMHGGTVEGHSAGRGQGSEFVVSLPCLPTPMPEARLPSPESPASASRGLRALVVDDSHDSAESMALLLRLDGHEVLTAHDGPTAVDVSLRERPDFVLLDIGLPGLNGYQACQAMRAGGLKAALIVAMTGYGQDEDRRRSHQAGFDAHLVKPVALQAVRALLAQRARP